MARAQTTPMLAMDEALAEDIARVFCTLQDLRAESSAEVVAGVLQKPLGEVRAILSSEAWGQVLARVQHEHETSLEGMGAMAVATLRGLLTYIRDGLERGEVDLSEVPALARPVVAILAEINKAKSKAGEFDHLPVINVVFDGGINPEPGKSKAERVEARASALSVSEVADTLQDADTVEAPDLYDLIDWEASRG